MRIVIQTPPALRTERVGALDAIRGMAIIAVVATHSLSATVASTESFRIPTEVFRVFDYGQFGVPLFFALSGWLLFALYTNTERFSARVYWSRRIARIWPLWAIFVVAFYFSWGVPDSGMPLWWGLLLNLLFLGWWSAALVSVPLGGLTIQQEMGHYLLFALFRKRGPAFLAGTVIIGYLSAWLARALMTSTSTDSLVNTIAEAWLRLSLFHSWPFFLLGGGAFVVYRTWRRDGIAPLLHTTPGTAILVSLAVTLGMLTTYAQETPAYFVLGYVISLAVLAIAIDAVPVAGRMMRSIGRYSYFMYFMHFIVLRWLESAYSRAGLPNSDTTSTTANVGILLCFFVLATAISWALGWVSWRIIESPIMTLTRRSVIQKPAP